MVQVFFPPVNPGQVYRVNGIQYALTFVGINLAMVAASAFGGGTVTVEGGHGSIIEPTSTPLVPKNNVKLVIEKGTKLVGPSVAAAGSIMQFFGTTTSGSVLNAGVSRNSRTCTLTAGGVAANAIVTDSICEIYNPSETRTQVNRIKSVAGDVIQWQYPMKFAWTTADKVRRWVTWLENFTLICEDDDQLLSTDVTTGFHGVWIQRYVNCEFQVRSNGFRGDGSVTFSCANRFAYGFESLHHDGYDRASGDLGVAAFEFAAEAYCHYDNLEVADGFGFGMEWLGCLSPIIKSPIASGCAGRGLKIHNSRDWQMISPQSNGNRNATYGSLAGGIGIMISGVDNLGGSLTTPITDGNEAVGWQTSSEGVTNLRVVSPSASNNGSFDMFTGAVDLNVSVSSPQSDTALITFQATGYYTGITHTVNTTDATVTVLALLVANQHQAIIATTHISGHRTGGAAGAADDTGSYILSAGFRGDGTNCNQVGATVVELSVEDQAAWNAVIAPSGNSIAIVITGAINNNITWKSVTDLVIT